MPKVTSRTKKSDESLALEEPKSDLIEDAQVLKRDEIDKRAEELKKKRQLPKPPGKMLDFRQLLEWTDLFNEDMWDHVTIYVYRSYPVIDKRKFDKEALTNIDVISNKDALTEDYMINVHGGGRYKFIIKDDDVNHRVTEAKLEIPIQEHWPKLDYAELDMTAPINRGFIQSCIAQGYIDKEGNPKNNMQSSSSDTKPLVDLVKVLMTQVQNMSSSQYRDLQSRTSDSGMGKILDILHKGNESQMNFMLEQLKQVREDQGKSSPMSQMKEVIELVKGVSPKGEGGIDFVKLMEIQQKQHEAQMKIVERMFELANKEKDTGKKEESGDNFDKYLGILERLQTLGVLTIGGNSGGGGSSRPWYVEAMEHGAPLVQQVLGTLNSYFAYRQSGGGPKKGGAVPANRHLLETGGRETVEEEQRTNYGPEPKAEPRPEPNPQEQPSKTPLVDQYGQIIINALDNGDTGDVFAENIENVFGTQVYASIAGIGENELVNQLQAHEGFWKHITTAYGEKRVRKFVHDFVDYPNKVYSDEEGEGNTEDASKVQSV